MTDERRGKVSVRLYTRPGCHLCDEARREMHAAGVAELYELEEIDIDSDPELTRRFGWDIPVVAIGDAVVFKHRLTRADFKREIQAASSV
ncbi:MAG: glutaredoxin family protein [Acidobacteria bacterium]|nr:glutaredoxin family protein [Acidobacteriota bacterium]